MKDSFGGTILIYVVIFFLGIYIVLIALTLRYSQAFKTKNKIIDVIEQYDGIKSSRDDDPVNVEIVNHLRSANVTPRDVNIELISNHDLRNTCYYKISSNIEWSWPFFGYSGVWTISGETKNVKNCNTIVIDDSRF